MAEKPSEQTDLRGARNHPSESEIDLARERTRTVREILAWPLRLVALGFVVWLAQPIAKTFSGETTNVNVTLGITITLAGGIIIGAMAVKMRGQRQEIRRLRRRVEQLTRDLTDARQLRVSPGTRVDPSDRTEEPLPDEH